MYNIKYTCYIASSDEVFSIRILHLINSPPYSTILSRKEVLLLLLSLLLLNEILFLGLTIEPMLCWKNFYVRKQILQQNQQQTS